MLSLICCFVPTSRCQPSSLLSPNPTWHIAIATVPSSLRDIYAKRGHGPLEACSRFHSNSNSYSRPSAFPCAYLMAPMSAQVAYRLSKFLPLFGNSSRRYRKVSVFKPGVFDPYVFTQPPSLLKFNGFLLSGKVQPSIMTPNAISHSSFSGLILSSNMSIANRTTLLV